MFLSDPLAWAQSLFQSVELGDFRRTQRLVQLSAQLAAHSGQSIVQSLQSDAEIEDSKRTGVVGWERLWQGWFELQTILEGYHLSRSLDEEM